MVRPLRIGTRGSALALVQAGWAVDRLAEIGVPSELVVIRTEGDDRPADTAWGEGAFVAAIAAALLDRRIDVAVHSAKDVPTEEDPRLVVAAYPPREDPRDALVARVRGTTLATLPRGARVGTDSPRRTAFLRAARPDLRLHPLHGNVDTRLAKLDRGESDALVLAVAGLTRLGRADRIDEILPIEVAVPAPGQGALAVQARADDQDAVAALRRLDDPATRAAVEAERALLNATGGGCRSPIGAAARVDGEELVLVAAAERSIVAAAGMARVGFVRARGPVRDRISLAQAAAARIVALRERPRALITRPARGELLGAQLLAAGVEPVLVPTIATRAAGPGGDLDRAVALVRDGDWIVATSATAVRATLDAFGRTGRDPGLGRWAAVGEATACLIDAHGLEVAFRPSLATGAALAAELPVEAGGRVLFPRGDLADPGTADILRRRGTDVTDVVAYTTTEGPPERRADLSAALDAGPLDVLVFTSGSTARGLLALASQATRRTLLATRVVAIGEPTAAVARGLGFADVRVSRGESSGALAAAVAAAVLPASAVSAHASPTLGGAR